MRLLINYLKKKKTQLVGALKLQALDKKKYSILMVSTLNQQNILQRKSHIVFACKANNNNPGAHLFIVLLLFYVIYLMVSHKMINHLWQKYDPLLIFLDLLFFFPCLPQDLPKSFHSIFEGANEASNPNPDSEASITRKSNTSWYTSPRQPLHRAAPRVLNMWSCTRKLNNEKSKYAGL